MDVAKAGVLSNGTPGVIFGANAPIMAGPTSGSMTNIEINIPANKVGLVIGKGGDTIKSLQEKYGVKMMIVQENPAQTGDKPLRISGDSSRCEDAKTAVMEIIEERDSNGQGGYMGRMGGSNSSMNSDKQYFGGGGGSFVTPGMMNGAEIAVPQPAVGVIIGKGGEMIKKIQAETGARLQFNQSPVGNPNEQLCRLSGKPDQVAEARLRIMELIDSARDGEMGRGNRGGGSMPWGGGRSGGGGGSWGGDGPASEIVFSVPANKCGLVIGKGGETIKMINSQSGAHCELDRRPPNNPNEKVFIIRGTHEQIELAKQLISEKCGMPPPVGGLPPTQYPIGQGGIPPGHPNSGYGPPGAWGNPYGQYPAQDAVPQQDYSAQWVEYYRNIGMHGQAALIESQAKQRAAAGGAPNPAPAQQPSAPAQNAAGTEENKPDYSKQWIEYYRSQGMHKEADTIEQQLKARGTANSPQAGMNYGTANMYQGTTTTGGYAGAPSYGAIPQYPAY